MKFFPSTHLRYMNTYLLTRGSTRGTPFCRGSIRSCSCLFLLIIPILLVHLLISLCIGLSSSSLQFFLFNLQTIKFTLYTISTNCMPLSSVTFLISHFLYMHNHLRSFMSKIVFHSPFTFHVFSHNHHKPLCSSDKNLLVLA